MRKAKEKIKGIGGWLLIFIIYSIIILPRNFINLFGGNSLFSWMIATNLIVVLSTLIYLIFIFKKSKYSPLVVIISLWAQMIIISLSFFFVDVGELTQEIYGKAMDVNLSFETLIVSLLLVVLFWIIPWTLYFLKSKRVKNTFVN